jgi:hypothetical protein
MSGMNTVQRLLRPWTTPPVVNADLSGVEKRLDGVDAQLRELRKPRRPVHWTVWVLLLLIFGGSGVGLVQAATLSSDANQDLSSVSMDVNTFNLFVQETTSEQADAIDAEVQAVASLQVGNDAAAAKADKTAANYLAVVKRLHAIQSSAFDNVTAAESDATPFNDQRFALITASICSVLIGGVLSYLLMVLADYARIRRIS